MIRESAMPASLLSRSVLPADDAVEAVDPRGRRGRRYPLVALVSAAACAVAAGARSYAAVGHWLRRAL
ncbi:transposase family protein [Streptomyces wedmorensis]|uniref:transposase family protein n=1 Tax=Streptomyces wedmorensis TaxID=43759 RepID=UPI00344A556A